MSTGMLVVGTQSPGGPAPHISRPQNALQRSGRHAHAPRGHPSHGVPLTGSRCGRPTSQLNLPRFPSPIMMQYRHVWLKMTQNLQQQSAPPAVVMLSHATSAQLAGKGGAPVAVGRVQGNELLDDGRGEHRPQQGHPQLHIKGLQEEQRVVHDLPLLHQQPHARCTPGETDRYLKFFWGLPCFIGGVFEKFSGVLFEGCHGMR